MALLFSLDPSHEDIKAFMDDDERQYWDTQKGTPEERVKFWEALEALWRPIPDPTEGELQTYMHPHDWEHCKRGENREEILNFYRRQWKSQRKAAAIETRRQMEALHSLMPPPKTPEPTLGQILGRLQQPEDEPKSLSTEPESPKPEPPPTGGTKFPPQTADDKSIPFPALTEEQLRTDRIAQAYQSGQRPDPDDLVEERAAEVKYQQKLAEAWEKKRKELESPKPPDPRGEGQREPGARRNTQSKRSVVASSEPPVSILSWINSKRLRQLERWLWERPKTSWFVFVCILAFIFFPQWGGSVWNFFSTEAPVPTIVKKMSLSFYWFHWSANWVTVPLGIAMFLALFYLLVMGRRASQNKTKRERHNLWFEIDEKQSQVRIDGYGGNTRRIEASIMLRCVKDAERILAARRFRASLFRRTESLDELVIPEENTQIAWDEKHNLDTDFDKGIIVDRPFTPYHYVHFYLEISPDDEARLSDDLFLRVSMFAVGREDPYSVDFYVDEWADARHSNSSITIFRLSDELI